MICAQLWLCSTGFKIIIIIICNIYYLYIYSHTHKNEMQFLTPCVRVTLSPACPGSLSAQHDKSGTTSSQLFPMLCKDGETTEEHSEPSPPSSLQSSPARGTRRSASAQRGQPADRNTTGDPSIFALPLLKAWGVWGKISDTWNTALFGSCAQPEGHTACCNGGISDVRSKTHKAIGR